MTLPLLAAAVLLQVGAAPPSERAFDPDALPIVLQRPNEAHGPTHGPWWSTIEWTPLERTVALRWFVPPWIDQSFEVNVARLSAEPMRFSTAYVPTSCTAIDDERVLVGGVDDAGRTLLELWTLGWLPRDEHPLLPATGGLARTDVEPARLAVRVVWIADEPGRRWVEGLAPLLRAHRAPTHALARFHDSGDVVQVHLEQGVLRLVATGEALARIGADGHDRGHGCYSLLPRDTLDRGCIYEMWVRQTLPRSCILGRIELPALLDPNRDGVVDRWERIDWPPFDLGR